MKRVCLKNKDELNKVTLKNQNGLEAAFLKTNGALYNISYGSLGINLLSGHPLEGAIQNIYLRIIKEEGIEYSPLMGLYSNSEIFYNQKVIRWQGVFKGLSYALSLLLHPKENIWFWSTEIQNTTSQEVALELVYFQDKGLAEQAAIKSNEFYTSHYIDNKIFETIEQGYIICSRQNQLQEGNNPWLMEGGLEQVTGYATDAIQFYGTQYKEKSKPCLLGQKNFPNIKVQGEYSSTILKTKEYKLAAQNKKEITFFAFFKVDHKKVTTDTDLEVLGKLAKFYQESKTAQDEKDLKAINSRKSLFTLAPLFEAKTLDKTEIERYFGSDLRHVEEEQGEILSFFYEDYHVVLKAKEIMAERPHAHIVRSGNNLYPENDMLSSTNYMYGCFNSQLSIGNTSFNRLLSHPRSFLNLLKSSGQRIFVEVGNKWCLLGVPSAYEIGFNSCRWFYKSDDLNIIVHTWVSLTEPVVHLEIEVDDDKEISFIIVNEISLGVTEYEQRGEIFIDETSYTAFVLPEADSFIRKKYQECKFFITVSDKEKVEKIGGEELILDDGLNEGWPYLVIRTKPTSQFCLTVGGSIASTAKADDLANKYSQADKVNFQNERIEAALHWRKVLKKIKLAIPGPIAQEVSKIEDILYWYLHNAIIHFSSPRGLEQYNGAAWGVRDVLQGSMEFLLALNRYDDAKRILKTVFSHQFIEDKNWPQWFMFDEFRSICDSHSHGDIIIWPFKAVSEYIEETNDFSILEEIVSYTKKEDDNKSFTEETATVFEHLESALMTIKQSFIEGTSLSCYGGGDWDDTLQPVNQDLKKNMVSGWTVAITYQYLNKFLGICEKAGKEDMAAELKELVRKIKRDYREYVIKDGIVSGFLYFREDKTIDYLLHPADEKTGIKYRLLPMTRCMIAEIFSKEEVKIHYDLIKRELRFMDGVRLMDKYAPYNGGVSRIFKRAEQSAYCGREVGLLYVHAHLRYIEAMIKIGAADEVFKAIKQVIPITIEREVRNAQKRQSNSYFSSADADFKDRYQAKQAFHKIRTGDVLSKCGWRIYSSGPGIFLHLIINNFLGIRRSFGDLIIDPVIPLEMDRLSLDMMYNDDKKIKYIFVTAGNHCCGVAEVRVNKQNLKVKNMENPYRKAGVRISQKDFEDALETRENIVEVILG